MNLASIRLLFLISGLYDLIIAIAFLVAGPQIYEVANVTPPNHWGYLQFGALLVAIFGLMFLAVAMAPARHRNLIPFGILLKISYVAVVGYYFINGGVPVLFQPFAVIDAIMLVLFAVAYQAIPRQIPANA